MRLMNNLLGATTKRRVPQGDSVLVEKQQPQSIVLMPLVPAGTARALGMNRDKLNLSYSRHPIPTGFITLIEASQRPSQASTDE